MSEEGTASEVATSGASAAAETTAAPSSSQNTSTASGAPAQAIAPKTIAQKIEAAAAAANQSAEQAPGAVPPGTAVPPQYQPNFKFKFLDQDGKTRKEQEFDEWLKPILKDPDTEKKVRELYEKAYGLDYTKASRDKFRGESETLRGEIAQTKQSLNVLSSYVNKGDLQSFFEALKIPEDQVLKYALDRINYRDMPPEKRQEYDGMRNTAQRAAFLEEQNQVLFQQMQNTGVQQRTYELERAMSDSNVSQIAKAYDERVGEAGAFQKEVIARGAYHYAVHKRDIPADQAVKEVLMLVGGMNPAPQVPAPTPMQVASPGATPVGSHTPREIPVLPNIQGRGTSPAKKLPRSIKDLKALAAEAS